jgi:hypothetical protein
VKPESPSELKGYLGQRRLVSAGDCQSAVGAGTHKCVGLITSNISWRLAKWKAIVKTITSLKTVWRRRPSVIRYWDDLNRKIIRSLNVIFDRCAMYRDGSRVEPDGTKQEPKKSKFC